MFFILFTGIKGRSLEFQEPLDLRSNPFQGGGNDAILPPQGHWIEDSKKIGPEMQEKALGFSRVLG